MYLDEIYLENTGPIAKCHVNMPFADDGAPRPVVIVGPNGSGKSVFLSYIVDALMEFAKTAFRDIVPAEGTYEPYYRVILPMAIRSGAEYSLTFQHFKTAKHDFHYIEKAGTLDPTADRLSNLKSECPSSLLSWPLSKSYKKVSSDPQDVKETLVRGCHVFFPASRREKPNWLNQESMKLDSVTATQLRLHDKLGKPIIVETCAEDTLSWLLDVSFDSMIDLSKLHSNPDLAHPETQQYVQQKEALWTAKLKVEAILKTILQVDSAELLPNVRNTAPSRLSILLSDGIRIPSLQSLSEGQLLLFNLFSTIIRYGEQFDLNWSIRLEDITGIVLIDEIDAHLHSSLQYEVVPQLIKLFPKVQFIVSSHSPLFLLGMEKEFDPDGLKILEFPSVQRITSERYTEFRSVFHYYQETDAFQKQIEKHFKEGTKPLVLTEGRIDVHYIKTALDLFGKLHLLDSIDVEFVGIKTKDSSRSGGASWLDKFWSIYEANPSAFHRPILLLYDSDTNKPPEKVHNISVRTVPKNDENAKVEAGIENLFPEQLFKDRFFNTHKKKDGGTTTVCNKKAFCDWICDERKDSADFEKFDSVIEILEEFSAAHQSNDTGK